LASNAGLWLTEEICGFAIIGHNFLRICELRTGTPKKFEDLQSRKDPKNLLIGELRTWKQYFCPALKKRQRIYFLDLVISRDWYFGSTVIFTE
jgi:hypothetical protein